MTPLIYYTFTFTSGLEVNWCYVNISPGREHPHDATCEITFRVSQSLRSAGVESASPFSQYQDQYQHQCRHRHRPLHSTGGSLPFYYHHANARHEVVHGCQP